MFFHSAQRNGPHLSGHPDTDVWVLPYGGDAVHEIVVVDGMVVEAGPVPVFGEGWM